jgi:hypothetical protein
MKSFWFLMVAILANASIVNAQDVIGKYKAVTETEAVIELELKNNNAVELITGYLPTEPDETFTPYVRNGRWSQSDGFVTIEIEDLNTLIYKIEEFLPYSRFGDKGGSFGLSPYNITERPFNLYGLWLKSNLDAHFKH